MKIALFGTDNSGKTTLASKFRKFGYKILAPLGPAEPNRQIDYMIEHLVSKENVIFDRLPIIEEEVCGNIIRGKANLSIKDVYSQCLMSKIDLFVFCNPGINSILKTFDERAQMKGVYENIGKLYGGYSDVFKYLQSNGYNVYEYNYNLDTNGEMLIEDYIKNGGGI